MHFSFLLPISLAMFASAQQPKGIPFGPKGIPDSHANCCYEVVNHDPSTICCICLSPLVINGNIVYEAGSNCPADDRACGPACTWNDTCCWKKSTDQPQNADCFYYGQNTGRKIGLSVAQKYCGAQCPSDYTPP